MAFVYAVYLVIRKLTHGIDVDGWLSLMVSIWFIGGVIIFSIGILGIYISKIYMEVKARPYSIIKKSWGFN